MKNIFYFFVTALLLLSSCKPIQYHPYFSQTAYTSADVNIITYSGPYKNSKDWERWHNEVTDLMAKKCPNYVLLKQYSNEKGGGSGTIRNSDGSYSNYTNTTKTYYHFEFKCNGSLPEPISNYTLPEPTKREEYLLYEDSGHYSSNAKNYTKAIQNFSKVIELNPNYHLGYYYRATAKSILGDLDGEIEDNTKAIELKPNYVMAYNNRGLAKLKQKKYIEALKDFNKVIELKPDYLGYFTRAKVKSALGDSKGSIEDFTKVIELDPKWVMAYNNRGWENFLLKNYGEALKDFDKAIELDTRNAVVYNSRQETKFALNDFAGCMADCNMAISLDPKLANPYLFRGKVYFENGDKLKACENWRKAFELGATEANELIKQNCN
jgi:tetratricopeptide (TPR) repeat protein